MKVAGDETVKEVRGALEDGRAGVKTQE